MLAASKNRSEGLYSAWVTVRWKKNNGSQSLNKRIGLTMSIRKSRISIAVMWAMIPLTVLGGLPRIGCICANGQHKFFCERHLMKAGDAKCACCYGRGAAQSELANGTHSCPSVSMDCCGAKRASHDGKLPAFGVDCPCRPVVDRSVLITPIKAVLDLDQAAHTPLFLAAVPRMAVISAVSFDHARGELPPPPDLVTTLGVLLI